MKPKIAGAPISWGVCEVDGWGMQLEPERVLGDMRSLGLGATELGPDGYLPSDPEALRLLLDSYNLELVAGFVAAPLTSERRDDVLDEVRRQAQTLAGAGAQTLVLAVVDDVDGYDGRVELDAAAWQRIFDGIDAVEQVARDAGLIVALHPHVGTLVERVADIDMVAENCSVPFCLDTGHMLIGGVNLAEFVDMHASRIGLVHLKDVRARLAAEVRSGAISYSSAVHAGLYVPIGNGDVDMAAVVGCLAAAGYDGWYVLEQDTAITSVDQDPLVDARISVEAVTRLFDSLVGGGIA